MAKIIKVIDTMKVKIITLLLLFVLIVSVLSILFDIKLMPLNDNIEIKLPIFYILVLLLFSVPNYIVVFLSILFLLKNPTNDFLGFMLYISLIDLLCSSVSDFWGFSKKHNYEETA